MTPAGIPVVLDHPGVTDDDLALWAVDLGDPWNGWACPVVTAEEFRRWVYAWSGTDRRTRDGMGGPRGGWHGEVTVGDGGLIFRDDDHDAPDVFPVCGQLPDGTPVYLIEGWTLVER